MATTKFIESGTAATQDFKFWTSTDSDTGGAITSDTQAIFGSVRSIKAAAGASPGGASCRIENGSINDSGTRISFGFRFSGTINSDPPAADFLDIFTSGFGATVFNLGISNTGKLVLFAGGSTYATGTTTLSANTDYRISVTYTITDTTHNSITVYIDGVSELTVSNVTLPSASSALLFFGVFGHNSPGANVTFYSAHWYIDDGTTGDPGNIRVTAKRPNANGTANGFTTQIGSGGSGYGSGHSPQVNERPLSETNGWSLSNTTKTTEEYNIENVSTGDVNITGATIVDYTGWIWSSVNSTANSPVHNIIVNNVATAITESTTAALYTKIAGSSTYPAGTGTDIGMDAQYTTTPHLTRLFECGIMVAYIPAVAAISTGFRNLLGVGI